MTTIRDLLRDMINETVVMYEKYGTKEVTGENMEMYKEAQEILLNEYVETIKERIVG